MNCSTVFCVAVVLACGSAAAAVAPPNPTDFTQGKWDLVLEKSKFCNAKTAPKAGNRWIFEAGWGLIVTEWGGTAADGKPIVNRYVARYDGQKYPAGITRPDAAEAIVWKLVDPRHVEFTHYNKADKITSTYTREVSADGQSLTQVSTFIGQECKDVQVFERR